MRILIRKSFCQFSSGKVRGGKREELKQKMMGLYVRVSVWGRGVGYSWLGRVPGDSVSLWVLRHAVRKIFVDSTVAWIP